MKLNLNFVNKVPKIAKDNEIILLTQKVIKSKEIKQLAKSVLNWEPKRNIKDICKNGWNWQLRNPTGY